MLKIQLWAAVLIVVAGCVGVTRAQTPATTTTLMAGPAYTSKDGHSGPQFPQIDVLVRLTGGNATTAPIKPGDLSLLEGSTELGSGSSLRSFGDTGYGVKAILALDASGSMNGAPLDAIHKTIANFVNHARSQDRVEVLTFADDTRVEVPFGADKAELAARLQQVKSRGSLTRLYDGLLEALGQLDGAPPEYRQLTVISDGHDEGSQHSIDDVIAQAVKEKVSIESIGLTRSHPEYLQYLARMSQATGGNFAQAKTADELSGLIDQGIKAMRATPVAGFKVSKLAADGKTHTLEVRWQPQHLTADVAIQTPLVNNRNPWSIWGWVLAGCFLAGVLLLVIARRQARQEDRDEDLPVAPLPEATPVPHAATAVNRSGFTFVERDAPAAKPEDEPKRRMQTFVEETTPEEEAPAPQPTPAPQAAGRAKTQMPAFFDSLQSSPKLEATEGPMAGKSYTVIREFLIGAVEGNDLVIAGDPTLSGYHARVRLADHVLTIEDSGSTNGTFVNGLRLAQGRKLLKPGDEIRAGRSVFKVRG